MCITSITLSLTIYNHSACEAFSYLVNLLSSNTTSPVSNNDSIYTFYGLAPNMSYNVIVTVITDSGNAAFQVLSKLIKTHSLGSKFPNKVICYTILVYNIHIRSDSQGSQITHAAPTFCCA